MKKVIGLFEDSPKVESSSFTCLVTTSKLLFISLCMILALNLRAQSFSADAIDYDILLKDAFFASVGSNAYLGQQQPTYAISLNVGQHIRFGGRSSFDWEIGTDLPYATYGRPLGRIDEYDRCKNDPISCLEIPYQGVIRVGVTTALGRHDNDLYYSGYLGGTAEITPSQSAVSVSGDDVELERHLGSVLNYGATVGYRVTNRLMPVIGLGMVTTLNSTVDVTNSSGLTSPFQATSRSYFNPSFRLRFFFR